MAVSPRHRCCKCQRASLFSIALAAARATTARPAACQHPTAPGGGPGDAGHCPRHLSVAGRALQRQEQPMPRIANGRALDDCGPRSASNGTGWTTSSRLSWLRVGSPKVRVSSHARDPRTRSRRRSRPPFTRDRASRARVPASGSCEKRYVRAGGNRERHVLARSEPKRDIRHRRVSERCVFPTIMGRNGPTARATIRDRQPMWRDGRLRHLRRCQAVRQ